MTTEEPSENCSCYCQSISTTRHEHEHQHEHEHEHEHGHSTAQHSTSTPPRTIKLCGQTREKNANSTNSYNPTLPRTAHHTSSSHSTTTHRTPHITSDMGQWRSNQRLLIHATQSIKRRPLKTQQQARGCSPLPSVSSHPIPTHTQTHQTLAPHMLIFAPKGQIHGKAPPPCVPSLPEPLRSALHGQGGVADAVAVASARLKWV